jgi:hypothetical protein
MVTTQLLADFIYGKTLLTKFNNLPLQGDRQS